MKMLSDSDKDELLQMVLKEQAHHEVNHQRPPSNSHKPIANFVQPPKATTVVLHARPQVKAHRPTPSADHDDSSEVEMLSISSGDEKIARKPRTRSHSASGRAGSRGEDDRLWDGDETDTWKRVGEAELSWRVRKMRETRMASVAQKFEKKPSVVIRKGPNNLQSFPRGMECVVPLGLG